MVSFVQRLSVVDLVFFTFRIYLGQLVIAVGRLFIVLDLVVTESKERKSSPVLRGKLKLVTQQLNHIIKLLVFDELVHYLSVLAIWQLSELVIHI